MTISYIFEDVHSLLVESCYIRAILIGILNSSNKRLLLVETVESQEEQRHVITSPLPYFFFHFKGFSHFKQNGASLLIIFLF